MVFMGRGFTSGGQKSVSGCDLSLDFSVLSDSTRFTFPHRFMCSLSRHGMVHNSESRDTKLFNDVIHVQVQSSIHP